MQQYVDVFRVSDHKLCHKLLQIIDCSEVYKVCPGNVGMFKLLLVEILIIFSFDFEYTNWEKMSHLMSI